MAQEGQQNPDLAAILPHSQAYLSRRLSHTRTNKFMNRTIVIKGTKIPRSTISLSRAINIDHHLTPVFAGRPAPQHRQPPPKPQDRISSPLIDPFNHYRMEARSRCVSKIAGQNPDFAPAVRKIITPGLLEGTALLRTPEREKEELDQYDAKVYRACKAMVDSQSSSLKALGVPFFGVKPYLVLGASYDPIEVVDSQTVAVGEGGKITKEKLLELQRKMLNHLMELYGD
ncbi:hypothetical protein J3E73DRAFT_428002 [Bipolaris maydis]|nr:hypothetical protein J3E73DRAFT_428002 [Bipolaris maydis]